LKSDKKIHEELMDSMALRRVATWCWLQIAAKIVREDDSESTKDSTCSTKRSVATISEKSKFQTVLKMASAKGDMCAVQRGRGGRKSRKETKREETKSEKMKGGREKEVTKKNKKKKKDNSR
jgi:hypothetical protein